MSRTRKHISLTDKLAATLACLLTQDHRDDLRSRKVTASEVISLFQFDHIALHAFDGSDEWHNLDPKLFAIHREKSKKDTSIVAKARRIDKKYPKYGVSLMLKTEPEILVKKKYKWPKRKTNWPKRPFKST